MTLFDKLFEAAAKLTGKISWKQRNPLPIEVKSIIAEKLISDYYIIATRRQNYLSTFFINLGHFLFTGRWGYYSHVLMNLEDEVTKLADFRLIEATGSGTHYSPFSKVFDTVDSVALLKPKGIAIEEWSFIMDKVKQQLGKPYDNLFDIANDQALSCVELIRIGLTSLPDYKTRFAHFERTIAKKKNLTPQMYLECTDFEIVWQYKG